MKIKVLNPSQMHGFKKMNFDWCSQKQLLRSGRRLGPIISYSMTVVWYLELLS